MCLSININNIYLSEDEIKLRPFSQEDLLDFCSYTSDDNVCNIEYSKTMANALENLMLIIEGKETLAIEYENVVVGSIGIHEIKSDKLYSIEGNGFELGYVISKSYWNKGIATRAVSLIKNYLFKNLPISFLAVIYREGNIQSQRVVEKNGFSFYCSFNDTIIRNDVIENVYVLYRKDYERMDSEILKVYDKNTLTPVDRLFRRSEIVPDIYVFGVAEIICYNTKYHKFLLTKRAPNKTYANMFEVTGGAIDYNEIEIDAAKRELFEETGVVPYEIQFIEKKMYNKYLFFEYIAFTDCELDSIVLQEKETISYKWVKYNELIYFFESRYSIASQRKRIYNSLKELKNYEKEI